MLQSLIRADRSVFRFINQEWTHPFLDAILPFFRNPFFWSPVYLFLLLFVGINFPKKLLWWTLFFLITFALTDSISTRIFKELFERARPCWDGITASSARMLIPCSHSFGFVSSHAANHFGMSTFIFFTMRHLTGRWLQLVFVWAFLVCYAQVYSGAHFPLDVICGGLLGFLIGRYMAALFQKRNQGLLHNVNLPLQ
ncbi:MAG: phosphatase PAP2 family protein [Lacibacter sp.]